MTFIPIFSHAQVNYWGHCGPNGNNPLSLCLILETNELLMGTYWQGIYRADINGQIWQSSHQGIIDSVAELDIVEILPIPNHPGSIVAGIESSQIKPQGYLYLSEDYGQSWSAINPIIPGVCSGILTFWIDPEVPNHWIWSGHTFTLYHTFDYGESWEYITSLIHKLKFSLKNSSKMAALFFFHISETGLRKKTHHSGPVCCDFAPSTTPL